MMSWTTWPIKNAGRALDVLSRDNVVPGKAIQVTVLDRLVTLTGKVNWHYQRTSAGRAEIDAKDRRIGIRDEDEVLIEENVKSWAEKRAVEHAAWSARMSRMRRTC
jgi:BON domain